MKSKTIVGLTSMLASAALLTAVFAAPVIAEESEYTWSIDLDCLLCHQKQADSLSGAASATEAMDDPIESADKTSADDADKTGSASEISDPANSEDADSENLTHLNAVSNYASMHVADFNIGCTDCHVDSDELAKGHKKLNSGKEAKRLKKSEVESTVCTSCHQVDDLADATKDCQLLVDTNDTVVNPHALPQGEGHAGIQCTDCHQVHNGKSIKESATSACLQCHHAGVFECNTCH